MENNKVYVVMETSIETDTTNIDYSDADTNLYGLYYKHEDARAAVRERIKELLDKPYYVYGTPVSDKRVEISCDGDVATWQARANEFKVQRVYNIDSHEIK